jgi:HSP20 family molecular chaperone IbpA
VPTVDIFETDDDIVVTAELPGLEKDQVGVEYKDGILTLRGERKLEREVKEESYHRMERSYGVFHRSFTLPGTVDEEKISARMKNGVLEIHLPKKEGVEEIKVAPDRIGMRQRTVGPAFRRAGSHDSLNEGRRSWLRALWDLFGLSGTRTR